MTHRAWLACLLAGLFIVSGLLADEVILKTKDGATYQGDFTDHGDTVSVNSHNVETTIPRADIASIEHMAAYEQDFHDRLAKLDPKDSAARIAMAKEAFDRGRYDLSRDALENGLVNDPNNRQIVDMLDLVQSQLRLEKLRQDPTALTSPSVAASPATPVPHTTAVQGGIEKRVLTPADIEAIRRYELKPTDTDVRIRFDGDVKKRFADSQNMVFSDFTQLPAVEQALNIFQSGDDTMRDKVHVVSDPQSILEYRRQIQPLVIQSCASIGCHGGPQGGSLILLTGNENDQTSYTNFFILQSFSKKTTQLTGVFSSGQQRLIDRGHAEHSLLVNYGLPETMSEFDHPIVAGKAITPVFRNRLDARYLMIVAWMDDSLVQIEPSYGIRYTPPTAATPATQPARKPAP